MRLPLERAMLGGDSDPRNEGVMNLLHLVRIGDKAGTGIPNIILKMKKLGYPEPIWKDEAFPCKTTLTLLLTKVSSSKTNNTLEKKIIAFLAKEGESSITEIANALNVANATISLTIKTLKQRGIVEDNGKPTKGKLFFLAM